MRKQTSLKEGDVVRLRKRDRGYVPGEAARVKHLYSDIPGGVVLDREMDGFRSWNEDDLTIIRRN